jgi:hypothetical protein
MCAPPSSLMILADLLDRVFRIYRAHLWTFLGIVACTYLPWLLVLSLLLGIPSWYELAIYLNIVSTHFDALSLRTPVDPPTQLITLLLLIQEVLLFPLITGALIAACDARTEQPPTILAAYRAVVPTFARLIAATLAPTSFGIVAVLVGQHLGVGAELRISAAGLSWGWSDELIRPLWLLIALGFGTLALYFSLSAQAAVLERQTVLQAWRQSRQIVHGALWHILAVLLLTGAITYIFTRGLSLLLEGLALLGIWWINGMTIGIETICAQVGWIVGMPLSVIGLSLVYSQQRQQGVVLGDRIGLDPKSAERWA